MRPGRAAKCWSTARRGTATAGAAAIALAALAAPGRGDAVLLRPLRLSNQSYGESFTFIADLEDGSYVHVQLAITNLGPGSGHAICRALVVPPGRSPWKADVQLGKDAARYTPGPDERLAIGPCAAVVSGEAMRVDAPLGGATIRLSFGARPRLVSPPDHLLAVGREHYQTEILYPRVPVEAQLGIPGETPRKLAGGGYADHSRSDVSPKALATRWIRFRSLRDDPGFLLLGRQAVEGAFVPLWESHGDSQFVSCSRFDVQRAGEGRASSFRVEVACPDDHLRIDSMQLLYRDAPIEELGLVGKLVSPFVGSPVTYVYRGRLTEPGGQKRDGILEVEVASD